ncbi:hypothetical protein HK097_008996 [Rhizophlyctis rosea]|uniref:DHHA2 domain-containing protein n=1 Tax=Rhizophlyctis rosea TaxID=64517 RepID=A0AAD5SHN0_9FUNG|nr:hypothetical protein HK097_008996 [Rhizophlyctis rosea]
MPPSKLYQWLQSTKLLLRAKQYADVVLVMGNEAADLDSVVSSIAYAYLREAQSRSSSTIATTQPHNTLHLPLIAIPRSEFQLRTECTFALKTAYQNDDISSVLTFADEIDLQSLTQPPTSLSVILTDHNSLASTYSVLAPHITGIIDHHADSHHHPTADPRIISVVGSCTTLVVNEWQKAIQSSNPTTTTDPLATYLTPSLATLLLSPILIDTIDLNPSFYRATPQDITATQFLLPYLQNPTYTTLESAQPYFTSFFTALQKAKLEISHLPTPSLLIKDHKQWTFKCTTTNQSITVGISSVMFPLRGTNGWISRENSATPIIKAATTFAQERNLDLLIIMTAFDHAEAAAVGEDEAGAKGFQRELIPIFNPGFVISHPDETRKIVERLERSELELVKFQEVDGASLYVQNNVKCSRKQVQPIVQGICEGL